MNIITHQKVMGSSAYTTTVEVTRPNDTIAYAAGDVIGDVSGTAVLPFKNMAKEPGGDVIITSAELEIDVTAIPSGMSTFNLRLYNAQPATIVDNSEWNLVPEDRGKYLGKISLNTVTDEGATLFCDTDSINKQIHLTSGTLFVVMQTNTGFTPTASAVKRLTIHTLEV